MYEVPETRENPRVSILLDSTTGVLLVPGRFHQHVVSAIFKNLGTGTGVTNHLPKHMLYERQIDLQASW